MSASLEARIAPVLVGQVFLHAAMAGCRMAAPLVALGQGHGKTLAGALVALFALTQIFLSLPAGRFADRHGLRRPLAWCAVFSSAGLGLAAIWPRASVLWLTALLCGGSAGAAIIAMQRHVGRAARNPQELKKAYSLLAIAPAAANILGPMTAGLLMDASGPRLAFAVLASFPLLTWLVSRKARESMEEGASAPRPREGRAWDLFQAPGMKRLMLMNALMSTCWELHGFMVPLLGHERGMAASSIAAVLGAFAVAAAAVRALLPLLIHRLREWLLITLAVGLAGALLIVYPFAHSTLAMSACSALLGMSTGSVQPMVLSLMHRLTPAHRQGEAMALRLIFVNLIALTLPLLMGLTAGLAGASGAFWLAGGLVTLGSQAGIRLRELVDQ